jgi:2,4-dienoyl-CoA reductase-like NADH-dependent reductase (Old Yellow Enzyme family)
MKAILEEDVADIISMSRPFIREPDLILKLKAGKEASSCVTCDACHELFGNEMMRCGQT